MGRLHRGMLLARFEARAPHLSIAETCFGKKIVDDVCLTRVLGSPPDGFGVGKFEHD